MKLQVWRLAARNPQAALQAVQLPNSINSFETLERFLPHGAYTTLRTYHKNQALHLAAHIHRLEYSAALVEKPLEIDLPQVRTCLRHILQNAENDLRLRLVLDLSQEPGDLYFYAQPLHIPSPQDYQTGVKVLTTQLLQRQMPKAKLTSFIAQAGEFRRTLPPDIHEAIMVDSQSQLLEGLSSNFFAVIDGVIHTTERGILAGTTRALVLAEIKRLGLPLQLEGISLPQLPLVAEAFITSASRAVLPVRQINEFPTGHSIPGEITNKLMTAYHERVEADLEQI